MAAQNRIVAGRQFRTKADYEAALRDQKKIEIIKSKVNLESAKEVQHLYAEMQNGAYRFETMIGNDFDDEIYELAEQYKSQGKNEEGSKQKKKNKSRKDRHKAIKGSGKVSLNDFDDDMKREIAIQLKARDKRRKWIVALCSLGAAACFGYFGIYFYYMERTSADYDRLAKLKNSEVLSPTTKEKKIIIHGEEEVVELPDILNDYKTLYNKNKKLIGWLEIDDTIINYPVMQTSNNEYYLTHNYEQDYDKNGSIFMDSQCIVYPRSQNMILYGHHMKSGKMFGDLEKYAKEAYYKEHSIIKFDTIYEKSTYQVMFVFRTKVLKENEIAFKYYQFIDAGSEIEFNSYMKEMAEMSLYDTGVTALYGDELLTLSTCDNSQTDGRFVVVAKRIQ